MKKRWFASVFLMAWLITPGIVSPDESLGNLPPIGENAIRLFVVRHGEALSNVAHEAGMSAEELDHLTDLGKRQAEAVGRALAAQPVAAIFTSEAQRAYETMEVSGLAESKGLAIQKNAAFNKMALGNKEDGSGANFQWRIELWQKGSDPTPAGGESLSSAVERFVTTVKSLDYAYGKAVVITTHGEIIAGLAGSADALPSWKRWEKYQSALGSITVIDIEKNGPLVLRAFNIQPRVIE